VYRAILLTFNIQYSIFFLIKKTIKQEEIYVKEDP
jgi:hypothetical protein